MNILLTACCAGSPSPIAYKFIRGPFQFQVKAIGWVGSKVRFFFNCLWDGYLNVLLFLCLHNRAGYKVTVIDSSDPDWWKGKCLGKIGFFPSKYVAKLAASEKPLQVTHNIQIGDNETALKLLRDQVGNFLLDPMSCLQY